MLNGRADPRSRKVRRLWQLLIVPLALGVALIAPADPASADPEHGLRNVSTQQCLGTFGNHSILTYQCAYDLGQRWHHHPGTYATRVMNYHYSVCLDSNASGRVYTNPCTANNSYQEWRITSNSFGMQFKNVATGLCLDNNTSGAVYTRQCNGGNFQRWHT